MRWNPSLQEDYRLLAKDRLTKNARRWALLLWDLDHDGPASKRIKRMKEMKEVNNV